MFEELTESFAKSVDPDWNSSYKYFLQTTAVGLLVVKEHMETGEIIELPLMNSEESSFEEDSVLFDGEDIGEFRIPNVRDIPEYRRESRVGTVTRFAWYAFVTVLAASAAVLIAGLIYLNAVAV